MFFFFFFFFQAEDGIRDWSVTGVQTCALPISFATSLVAAGMNPLLAKRAVRIRSDKIFARYSDRALDIKLEEAFEEIYGASEESCFVDL